MKIDDITWSNDCIPPTCTLFSSNDGRFSIMICFHSKIMFIVQMRVFIHVRHFMGGIVVDILVLNHFHIPLLLPLLLLPSFLLPFLPLLFPTFFRLLFPLLHRIELVEIVPKTTFPFRRRFIRVSRTGVPVPAVPFKNESLVQKNESLVQKFIVSKKLISCFSKN